MRKGTKANRVSTAPDQPFQPTDGVIEIRGAKTHNLRNVDVDIPRDRLVVVTGVSGSGKSSLAIDTLFAEGQRQYLESLSTYARQFVDQLERPDVDVIRGIQPSLCIDQKQGSLSPRSTVGTVTEIYDYLRLLMAKVAVPACHQCGQPIDRQSHKDILDSILKLPVETKLTMLAPMVIGRKGAHADVFDRIAKAGLVRAKVDGQLYELEDLPTLAIRKEHSISAVVDRMIIRPDNEERISDSIHTALRLSNGLVEIHAEIRADGAAEKSKDVKSNSPIEKFYSTRFACTNCGINLLEVEPRTFSFNRAYGACPKCEGFGTVGEDKTICPTCDGTRLRKESLAIKLDGESIAEITARSISDARHWFSGRQWTGNRVTIGAPILKEILNRLTFLEEVGLGYLTLARGAETLSGGELQRVRLATSIGAGLTGVCYVLDEPSVGLHPRDTQSLIQSLKQLQRKGNSVIVVEHDEEMMRAADWIIDCGPGAGKNGGQIIAQGPSEWFFSDDAIKRFPSSVTAKHLTGATRSPESRNRPVITPSTEPPLASSEDATVVVSASLKSKATKKKAPAKSKRKDQSSNSENLNDGQNQSDGIQALTEGSIERQPELLLKGITLHNLRDLDVALPLKRLVGVAGVSGSGKSTLIHETLAPAIRNKLLGKKIPPHLDSIHGWEHIDKIIEIDQSPIGRSPRSIPATYCGFWDEIRKLYATTKGAKQRGLTATSFSFNSGTGRCEVCGGQGRQKLEMNFLADVYVLCPRCRGARFQRSTLAVRFKEKSIAHVLEMSMEEARDFFSEIPKLHSPLNRLCQVGLGYMPIGQSATTISGGEAQRIKLAAELSKTSTGNTLYLLDEPTSGLHAEDVHRLIEVFQSLVDQGNSMIVIEHHVDVLAACDWLIDMGPDAGINGGRIVTQGPPIVVSHSESPTGVALKARLQSR